MLKSRLKRSFSICTCLNRKSGEKVGCKEDIFLAGVKVKDELKPVFDTVKGLAQVWQRLVLEIFERLVREMVLVSLMALTKDITVEIQGGDFSASLCLLQIKVLRYCASDMQSKSVVVRRAVHLKLRLSC